MGASETAVEYGVRSTFGVAVGRFSGGNAVDVGSGEASLPAPFPDCAE
jgi:hypothetical protein